MPSGETSVRPLIPTIGGFVALLLAVGAAAFLSFQETQADRQARHIVEIQNQLSELQTLATEAETGQRGYLLTGRLEYLDPFETAIHDIGPMLDALAREVADNPTEAASVKTLRDAISEKLTELRQTIDLRAAGRAADALAIVNSDRGNDLMSAIRVRVADLVVEEKRVFDARAIRAIRYDFLAQAVLVGCVLLVVALAAATVSRERKRQLSLLAANQSLIKEAEERRAAENQIRQLQKMEAIGQLAGGMAHDFNNMLAVIVGSLDVVRTRLTGNENPSIRKFLDVALEGANRAALVTNRILAFSRQQPLAPAVLDANRLVGEMSELLRRMLGEAIAIETVLAGGLWKVKADSSQLESALLNLAVNARDAMPDGGKLTIETTNAWLDERYAANETEVTPGQYVMISVTDTGLGMAKSVAERAFDPFFTTKSTGKGTGLGLSQIYGFVKQSAGHVKIYSEVGRGTTVKLYLPRYFDDGTETATKEAASPRPAASAEQVILVVEDEDGVRQTTVALLRELGYTVIHAKLPSQALGMLKANPGVALLFTDVVMPEMNGRELAARATAEHRGLRVLYTTGYTRNAIVHNGVVDPDAAMIAKPFTLEQLAARIGQSLQVGGV